MTEHGDATGVPAGAFQQRDGSLGQFSVSVLASRKVKASGTESSAIRSRVNVVPTALSNSYPTGGRSVSRNSLRLPGSSMFGPKRNEYVAVIRCACGQRNWSLPRDRVALAIVSCVWIGQSGTRPLQGSSRLRMSALPLGHLLLTYRCDSSPDCTIGQQRSARWPESWGWRSEDVGPTSRRDPNVPGRMRMRPLPLTSRRVCLRMSLYAPRLPITLPGCGCTGE